MQPNNYVQMIDDAINFASELGLKNLNWTKFEYKYQEESEALEIYNLVNGELFDFIERNFAHYDYWGDKCLDLAVATFCFLKAKNYDVEIIYGNINANNSPEDEFDVTRKSLIYEYQNQVNKGEQDIHAWVGLGGNIIIDFALMDRLVKNYKYPIEFGSVILGPADYIRENYKVTYKPLLLGTEFFKVTNSYNPLDKLEELKK